MVLTIRNSGSATVLVASLWNGEVLLSQGGTSNYSHDLREVKAERILLFSLKTLFALLG